MKSIRPVACWMSGWVALASVFVASLAGAETRDAPAESGRKEFVVFFGLDVFAADGPQRRLVVGGTENQVWVEGDKPGATAALKRAALTSQTVPKLSRQQVEVSMLDAFPVHSPANNPLADAQSQMIALQNIQADRQEASEGRLRQAEYAVAQAGVAAAANPSGATRSELDAAQAEAAAALSNFGSLMATPEFRDFEPGSGAGDYAHDGYEVVFRVSAEQRLENTHGILRLILRAPQRPGVPLQALKVFRVRELTPQGRKMVVRIFGLPSGFEIQSCHVHLYANGRELATNLSPNRVELTADEAHQFLILRHAQQHPEAARPAEILTELRPAGQRVAIPPGQENALVHLAITAEGRVEKVESGTIGSALSPELEAAVRDVRFLPALLNGQPAASRGSFALGELLH